MLRAILAPLPILVAVTLSWSAPAPTDEVAARYIDEVWNQGSMAAIDAIIAADFERFPSLPGTAVHGREAFREYVKRTRAAYPDFEVTANKVEKVGDRTLLQWTVRGTNTGTGPWPATGKRIELKGSSDLRIVDGKIVVEYAGWNYVDVYHQLGIDPSATVPAGNIAIVREAFDEIYNMGNVSRADASFSKEHVFHVTAAAELGSRGAEDIKKRAQAFRRGFPDLVLSFDQMIAEGDTVAARITITGTHKGEFLGIAPTGKAVNLQVVSMSRVRDGQIVESWASWDSGELKRQLGVAGDR